MQSGDLTVSGKYYCELQVTYAGGAVQTFALDDAGREVYFVVRDEIA